MSTASSCDARAQHRPCIEPPISPEPRSTSDRAVVIFYEVICAGKLIAWRLCGFSAFAPTSLPRLRNWDELATLTDRWILPGETREASPVVAQRRDRSSFPCTRPAAAGRRRSLPLSCRRSEGNPRP